MTAFFPVLRGHRDYIPAADLLDLTFSALPAGYEPKHIDLTCMRKAKTPIRLVPFAPDAYAGAYARYRDSEHDFLVVPHDGFLGERVACNEDSLRAYFAAVGKNAHVDVPDVFPASIARQVVAAFKHLLHQPANLGPAVKFVVSRLRLAAVFSGPFSVTYTRMVGGDFYEGDICQGGRSLGKVYFAEEKKA